MQINTAANPERQEQLDALGFTGEADYAAHHALMDKSRSLAVQQLRDSVAAGGLPPVHLSETGLHAGRRLCLAPHDGVSRSVHAVYAPLHNPTFLATVCEKCLHIYALEAYDDHDEIPEHLIEARAAAKLAAADAERVAGEKAGQ